MQWVQKVMRELAELRQLLSLLRKVLIRQGTIDSVDTTACTVVVVFPNEDVQGAPAKSHPMPWLQRSSEHRPPAVGDHALVLDPSLGAGAGLVIVGWPSTLKPSPGVATSAHVLYKGTEAASIYSPDVQLGVAPTDFASLASRVLAELNSVKTDLDGFKSVFDLHTHGGAFGGTGSGPAITTPPTSAPPPSIVPQAFPAPHTPASVAAAQVKIK